MERQSGRTGNSDHRAFESMVYDLPAGSPDQRPLTVAQRRQVLAYITAIVRSPARAAAAESDEALMLGPLGQVPRYLRRAAGAVRALGRRGLPARHAATLENRPTRALRRARTGRMALPQRVGRTPHWPVPIGPGRARGVVSAQWSEALSGWIPRRE
jgi:hypothetical protein